MNKWLLSVAMLLCGLLSYAQSPQAMNFQAVARNAGGNPLSEKEVGIKVEVLQGSTSGAVVYGETHQATTAKNGVVNLQIGLGTPVQGVFSTIDWSQSPYFLRVSMDIEGGTDYKEMATSQMLSVPYALYAEKAGSVGEETEKKHDFWVLPIGGEEAGLLSGIAIRISFSSINGGGTSCGFFVKYTDEIDQEVELEVQGVTSGISIDITSSFTSATAGKFFQVRLTPNEYTRIGTYDCNLIFKNKYGITKRYPFTYETIGEGVYPEDHWKTNEEVLASISEVIDPNGENPYDSFDEFENVDMDFMKGLGDRYDYIFENKDYDPDESWIGWLWEGQYNNTLKRSNNLIEGLSNNTNPDISESVKSNAIKQAKAIRGYSHLILTTWYGRVPLMLKTWESSEVNSVSQSERSEVLEAVISDLKDAQGVTPLLEKEEGELSSEEIQILLYEAQLLKGDYQVVSTALEGEQTGILSFIKKVADWKRNSTEGITEASLMEEYMTNYHDTYKRGNLYLNILEYSAEYFNMDAYKALLPIPQSEMDKNTNLTQNPGY